MKVNLNFIISVGLLFIIPFYLLLDGDIYSLPIWLTLLITIYLIARLFIDRFDDFLYSSFLSFFYVFLLLAPIIQISNGHFPWLDYYDSATVDKSWWITFLSLFFFELGYVFYKNRKDSTDGDVLFLSDFGFWALVLIALLTMAIGIYLNGAGSIFLPRNFITDSHQNSVISIMINTAILRVPSIFVLILLYQDILVKNDILRKYKNKFLNTSILAVLFLLVVIVNNPISTPRFWVGAIFFSLLIVFLKYKTKKGAPFWFKLNVFVLVLAFPLMDLFRNTLDTDIYQAVQEVSPFNELSTSPDFDAFQQQLNTVVYVHNFDTQNGLQLLSSILFFVPRNIWTSKSEASGVLVADSLNYNFLNLSSPLTAEVYIDFCFYGIIVLMFFLGVMYRYINYTLNINNSLLYTLYGFFCAYQIYFLRGSLMAVMPFLFVFFICFISTLIFKTRIFKKYLLIKR
jgi:hypothetical protein